ncbi:hypothetical protein [Lysinibacillus sp. BPa_S21]|uniref:hypothetical protein n=1 Tax=Lysinibacillus sp. BPa_S21 TaxID=2932478 RepID=UPI002011E192|nr:hypothetical protein [Lysinibacillus sp. BPa_S21]MCL1696422.1 hypothetical protein [Lysinibacillus sp. BPa_S21]
MMKSRKERKLEAKQKGVPFAPQYNGNGVISAEDFYGTGTERFNNKFIQFDKSVEKVADEVINSYKEYVQERRDEIDEVELNNNKSEIEEEKIELIEPELEVEQPKKKKGKLKKALKKLLNK